jgi:tRNA A-37 threonylcarbamoyl transferase component Bud32
MRRPKLSSLPQKINNVKSRVIATNTKSASSKLRADLNEYAWPMVMNGLNGPFDFMSGRLPAPIAFGVVGLIVLSVAFHWMSVVNHDRITTWLANLDTFGTWFSVLYIWLTTQSWFPVVLAVVVAAPVITLFRWAKPFEPAFISLDNDGIHCHWKIFAIPMKRKLRWQDIAHVGILKPLAKGGPESWLVSFGSDKFFASLKVPLTGLSDFDDRKRILNALNEFAPQATRDPELLEAFTPAASGSYTELWLQSLSAPPHRDRLKPLNSGARLKDQSYVIKEQLGSGGQGVAYLASARDLGASEVVLKESILPVYLDIDVRKAALERFAKEAEMLRQLKHPQVVELFDFFIEDHRGYLVLEYIKGLSLRSLVDHNGRISESRTIELTKQMCTILTYLHAQAPPIVHRDFSPDNLILSSDNILKLIDFTVAEQSNNLKTAMIVGKPAYMPPEQLRGKPCPLSDIYALGATMYFLLTGENPEPISASNPNAQAVVCSDGIAQLIQKATALKVDDRYQTVSELESELE